MSLFKLKSQHTGTVKEFTLLDILNVIGDPVNDEIMLGEDVFNLSSFAELNGGGTGSNGSNGTSGGIIQVAALYSEYPQVTDGSTRISLQRTPATKLLLQLNGMELKQGNDYSYEGSAVSLSFTLVQTTQQQDIIKAVYD